MFMTDKKKVIVITGASKGLGKELSKFFNNERLILLSRKTGCDIASIKNIKRSFSRINRVDILINCAGIGMEKEFEKMTDKEVKRLIEVNLLGTVFTSLEAYKKMIKQKRGLIVNICSTSGKKGREKEAVYCASKWGVMGFSESLRLEARKHGIKVVVVVPGGMKTGFYKDNPQKDISDFMDPREVARLIVLVIKAGGRLCPAEIVIERDGP